MSGVADLSSLANFPHLRYLEVAGQQKFTPRPLDALSNLCGLQLETPGAGLDFSCFPELEVFQSHWHADNAHVHRCQALRRLRIWEYKPKLKPLGDLAIVTRFLRHRS